MFKFILLFLFAALPLCAERITVDPSSRSFRMQPPCKERVDTFDFAGFFPELENIDVNARRKKNVRFNLTGKYPILESINYEGAFGVLKGELTGNFPKLSLINFICTNCAMDFNLKTQWQQSCEINIRGADEDVVLKLPKEVGLVIHTKTGLKGKVIPYEGLKKKKWYSVLNKTFENELAESGPIVLTIHIEVGDGRIILN